MLMRLHQKRAHQPRVRVRPAILLDHRRSAMTSNARTVASAPLADSTNVAINSPGIGSPASKARAPCYRPLRMTPACEVPGHATAADANADSHAQRACAQWSSPALLPTPATGMGISTPGTCHHNFSVVNTVQAVVQQELTGMKQELTGMITVLNEIKNGVQNNGLKLSDVTLEQTAARLDREAKHKDARKKLDDAMERYAWGLERVRPKSAEMRLSAHSWLCVVYMAVSSPSASTSP